MMRSLRFAPLVRECAWRPRNVALRAMAREASSGTGSVTTMTASGDGGSSSSEPGGLGNVTSADEIPTLKLYRDCMRLTYHIAAQSSKGEAMRAMIRQSFRAQLHVTDTQEIHRLKMLAVVGLQNYVIHEQTGRALDKKKRGGK